MTATKWNASSSTTNSISRQRSGLAAVAAWGGIARAPQLCCLRQRVSQSALSAVQPCLQPAHSKPAQQGTTGCVAYIHTLGRKSLIREWAHVEVTWRCGGSTPPGWLAAWRSHPSAAASPPARAKPLLTTTTIVLSQLRTTAPLLKRNSQRQIASWTIGKNWPIPESNLHTC